MTWNYRVIRRTDATGSAEQFGIHEVYYDSTGRIEAWTEEPSTPFGESLAELQADLEFMAQALSRPTLKESGLVQDLAARGEEGRGSVGFDEGETDTTTSTPKTIL